MTEIRTTCASGATEIIKYFPEHTRAELTEHFKNGIIPMPNAAIRERIKLEYDLQCHKLNFTSQLLEAIFACGFIEGKRYAQTTV